MITNAWWENPDELLSILMASCTTKFNLYIYLNFNAQLLNMFDKIETDMCHLSITKVAISGFLFFTTGYGCEIYIKMYRNVYK